MWLLLIQVGFVGFLLSLFGLVWRGFNAQGAARRSAVGWSIAAALFFLLWLLALTRYPVPYPF
jgi:hypothetical protein